MDMFSARRLLANLFVVAAASAPVLYVGGVVRSDDGAPCPSQIPISVACEKFATAKCETYVVDIFDLEGSCDANRYKQVFNGPFECGADSTKSNACVQQNDLNGEPVFVE